MRINLSDSSRVVASTDQVSCDLAGETAILNLKSGVYYGLDTVGARVWNAIQQPATVAQICDDLQGVYEVDRSRLESDVRELLHQLSEQGLIDIRS